MNKTKIRITLPEELRDSLLEHCKDADVSVTTFINTLLTEALSGQENNNEKLHPDS